jgi:L-lysine exporter family protein LysE/ArgO
VSVIAGLHAAGLGLGLGVVTGMPLGVINVAIVDAVVAGRRRFASGLGLGGAAADALHAIAAFTGVGRLVTADPRLVRGLAIGAAAAIVGYAVLAWRRRAAPAPAPLKGRRGLATGFLLTLPNPGALAAWVAVAASVWPDATLLEAALLAGGVGAGSALWFLALARVVGRVRRDHPALVAIPRIALVVLIAIAIAGLVRAMTAAPA